MKVDGISRQTMRELERIAMDASYPLKLRGGIEGRGGDSEDFFDCSVYSIQRMLEEAYRLGRADAKNEK